MTEDPNIVKSPDTGEILKDRDANGTASVMPYYWSWYRLVFAGQGPQTGHKPDDPHLEKP